jgi:hypothetical protein
VAHTTLGFSRKLRGDEGIKEEEPGVVPGPSLLACARCRPYASSVSSLLLEVQRQHHSITYFILGAEESVPQLEGCRRPYILTELPTMIVGNLGYAPAQGLWALDMVLPLVYRNC